MGGMSTLPTSCPSPDRSPAPPARRYQPLVPVLAAVCLGILLDRHVSPALAVWWLTAALAWAAWLVGRWLGRDRAACVLLLVAAGATAGTWHHLRWSRFAADDIGCFAQATAQPVCVEAVVERGSRWLRAPAYNPMQIIPRGDRTELEVCVERIRDGTQWRAASGQATLSVDGRLPDIHPGDRLRVFGQLVSPRPACNPGEFNRAEYARGERIRGLIRAECPQCVSVTERGSAWCPRRWLEYIQNRASGGLWRRLDPRHAALASALLLGTREQLDPSQATAFQTTGMAHLLAISGMNVAIVVLTLAWVLRLMRVRPVPAAILLALAAVGYTLLTGSEPPVVRASILVVVFAAAVATGRQPSRFNSLATAALVVLALNPIDLFRAGPQLSFLSVAALMWCAPGWFGTGKRRDPLDVLIEENKPWPRRLLRGAARAILQAILVSLVVWLAILPLVMSRFHLLSPIAIPLTALLWIPVALALCSGFAVLTVGWLIRPLGTAAAWVCNGSLAMIDAGINAAQRIPCGHFWVPGPAGWWLWGFYGGLLVAAVAGRWRPPRRWLLAMLAGWIGVGLLASAWPSRPDRLDCTFLAVGHGLAVVLELPGGGSMVYDAGSFGSPDGTAQMIAGCLWQKGNTRIDAIVLSHADADHYNAVPGLLRRLPVGAVYVPPGMFAGEGRSLAALHEAIAAAGVPIRELAAGDRLVDKKSCRIEVLHPLRTGSSAGDNAGSLTLLVEYAGRRILLPGDLEPPGLDDVLAEEPIDCDVLLVPHHGSQRSSPPGLMTWSRPEQAVISGSLARDSEDTEAAYRAAGARVLHTGRMGAVRVQVGGFGDLSWGFRDDANLSATSGKNS